MSVPHQIRNSCVTSASPRVPPLPQPITDQSYLRFTRRKRSFPAHGQSQCRLLVPHRGPRANDALTKGSESCDRQVFFFWKLFSSKNATGSSSLFPFNFYQWNTFVSLMFFFRKIAIWNFRRTRRTSFLQDGWRRYFWHWLLFPSLLWFLFLFLELRCA